MSVTVNCSLSFFFLLLFLSTLAAVTEASHPAVASPDLISCLSSSAHCDLIATATNTGLVQVWDLNKALFLIVSLAMSMNSN